MAGYADEGVRYVDGKAELTEDLSSSPLYNEDLAPTPLKKRNWSKWNLAALWIGMSVCIPTYMLAAGLIANGMNWWQAVGTVLLGNLIVLVPMILNAHVGTKYGIPFPVFLRIPFGVRGSNIPALLRAVVACGWFGIQTWIGGAALYALGAVFWPQMSDMSDIVLGGANGFNLGVNPGELACFLAFWAINVAIIVAGIDSIKKLESWAAPVLLLIGLALLGWGIQSGGGLGTILERSEAFRQASLLAEKDGTVRWNAVQDETGTPRAEEMCLGIGPTAAEAKKVCQTLAGLPDAWRPFEPEVRIDLAVARAQAAEILELEEETDESKWVVAGQVRRRNPKDPILSPDSATAGETPDAQKPDGRVAIVSLDGAPLLADAEGVVKAVESLAADGLTVPLEGVVVIVDMTSANLDVVQYLATIFEDWEKEMAVQLVIRRAEGSAGIVAGMTSKAPLVVPRAVIGDTLPDNVPSAAVERAVARRRALTAAPSGTLTTALADWKQAGVEIRDLRNFHVSSMQVAVPKGGAGGGGGSGLLLFLASLTAMVGFWATLSLNIPDFTRYAKSQKDQVLGQAMGLPTTMALFSFIGVAVTCAAVVVFEDILIVEDAPWDPVALLSRFETPFVIVISMAALAVATLSTNIAANVVSPANDFSNISPRLISFRTGGLITAFIGIIMMPWKLLESPDIYIMTWLVGYGALLGPVGGILIADYYVVRGRRIRLADAFKEDGAYRYTGGFGLFGLFILFLSILPNIPGFLAQSFPELARELGISSFFSDAYSFAFFIGFGIAFCLYGAFAPRPPRVAKEEEDNGDVENGDWPPHVDRAVERVLDRAAERMTNRAKLALSDEDPTKKKDTPEVIPEGMADASPDFKPTDEDPKKLMIRFCREVKASLERLTLEKADDVEELLSEDGIKITKPSGLGEGFSPIGSGNGAMVGEMKEYEEVADWLLARVERHKGNPAEFLDTMEHDEIEEVRYLDARWKMKHERGRGYAHVRVFRLEEERFWIALEE